MFYNAMYGKIDIADAQMEYIRFGSGKRHLIMIPGLGDGLRTLKGTALPMAFMYRIFARDYTVWMLARKQPLENDCTTRTMAADVKTAMETLGIQKAHIIGVSQGGMIAQWLAADAPEMVDKLVLVVTAPQANTTIIANIDSWIEMVKNENFKAFAVDNFEKSYSENYLKKYRFLYPVITPLVKPQDKNRFLLQAQACLTHNAADSLQDINHQTLVVGGGRDKIVTREASVYLAEHIKNSRLKIYENLGHALYEEAKDFNKLVFDFLK